MARYSDEYDWSSRTRRPEPGWQVSGLGKDIGPADFPGGYRRASSPPRRLGVAGQNPGVRHEPRWGGTVYDAEYFRQQGWTTPWSQGYDAEYGGRPRRTQRSAERTRASELMTADPEVVTADATIEEAARRMEELDVGILPVVESGENPRLRGVITDRDIAIRAVAKGKNPSTTVGECMSHEAHSVNRNDSVDDVLQLMRRERVRRVPVTDREGRLVGIIAQADLAVDYAGFDHDREIEVEETIERISEPARPRR